MWRKIETEVTLISVLTWTIIICVNNIIYVVILLVRLISRYSYPHILPAAKWDILPWSLSVNMVLKDLEMLPPTNLNYTGRFKNDVSKT